jgi:hypothetical protein
VVFAYKKVCAETPIAADINLHLRRPKLLPLNRKKDQVAAETHLVNLIGKARDSPYNPPWGGLIPGGGARVIVLTVLILGVLTFIFEYGVFWVNQKLKAVLGKMGPQVFGVKTELGHIGISFAGGQFTYVMNDWIFHNPPGDYQGPYLLKIEEARVWLNFSKLICSCFSKVEVRSLIIRGLDVEVEVDGYFSGQPNIQVVLKKMQANNREWKQNLDKIKDDYSHVGIDPHEVISGIERRINRVLSKMTLKEVFIGNIFYSFASKLGGVKVALAEVDFHDFTEHHNYEGRECTGAGNIAYYLIEEIFSALAKDLAGMEVGHERFQEMLSSVKKRFA